MSRFVLNQVRKGSYMDSVALMKISSRLKNVDGVIEAGLMMGTPANHQIMDDAGVLADAGREAAPGDLVIAIAAADQESAEQALEIAISELDQPKDVAGESQDFNPRTIRTAVAQNPGTNLALISVAGDYAGSEARKALRRGLIVMIFSDNVPVSEEISLKEEARELGLLVMGPDCGTAIINGVPLAFANRVPRGDVGLVGASGTGLQEVSCLIGRLGAGVSHAIGVGGRDLSEEVGGLSTLTALDMLDEDLSTRHIVLISKPPAKAVAEKIFARIARSPKSFTVCLIGMDQMDLPANATFAATLKAAAESATGKTLDASDPLDAPHNGNGRPAPAGRGVVRGLYSGGTLAAEAQLIFLRHQCAVSSNVPVPGASALNQSEGHAMIDLGSDEYTQGRPHPMIDPAVRDAALEEAFGDAKVKVLLLDIILGYGAHGDPAGYFTEKLDKWGNNDTIVVASVCGGDDDFQGRDRQIEKLRRANVLVAPSNADAAELAYALIEDG